ncbi:MAG: M1 family metallopeptidase [Brumimicrobium sp.]|nr:M1 family metallopeptidase [Brumimicrobium sp.]
MKSKIVSLLIIGCSLNLSLFSQEIFIPRSVQKAYSNKTRSLDGKPGENYWQNKGKYDIQISINPPSRTITGVEKIIYTNNSPDTLKKLSIKLIQNHHKAESPRSRPVPDTYLTPGIKVDYYAENGAQRPWNESFWDGTDKWMELKTPLLPKQKVELTFKWNYEVSKQSGREGAIDSTTFFLGYFYPRVAVYDDYEGWDRMPHITAQEFYNDFNDYTLEVTVPKNYLVWATGDLLNPSEVLQETVVKNLEKSMTSDETMRIASFQDVLAGKITKQQETNTWKWSANHISDIACAISNHYNWDAASVVVDEKTGRRASTQAAYNEEAKDFQGMVGFIQHALGWFSTQYPGVPYPYSKMTVVRGQADMEFPMMANDNSQDDPMLTQFIAQHEIAHTWFPFYMGINETRFAFMDEGWTVFNEYFIGIDDVGKEKADTFFKEFRVQRWIDNDDFEKDLPIMIPTNNLTRNAAGDNIYGKAALSYLALRDYLGDERFKKALHGFMDRWNGKHPIPWDFFYSFNDLTGENLNWFWKKWYFDYGYIDLAIKNVQVEDEKVTIQIENKGGIPAPVDVILITKDGKEQRFHQTPEIWKSMANTASFQVTGVKDLKAIILDTGIWMDTNELNNTWELK